MTAQQRRGVKWGAVAAAIAALCTIAGFAIAGSKGIARAAAAEQVGPVAERVTRLEERRIADKEQLNKMDQKLDAIVEKIGARKE